MQISSQMLLFATVAEHGSFSAAARALGQTPSALSKRIGALEEQLGVRLVLRTQSGLQLTEAGSTLRQRALDIAARVADAEAEVMAMGARPIGQLNVASTTAFGRLHLVPALPAFNDAYPDIRIALSFGDEPANLASDNIDVAIRFAEQIDDPNLVCRRLARNRRVLCAAPAYLKRAGTPACITDLSRFNCLRLSTVESWNEWTFSSESGKIASVAQGNFDANSADAIHAATLAGMGIARLPMYLVGPDLHDGRLHRVLPDLTDDTTDIFAVYVDRHHLPSKIRVFVDHLAKTWSGTPPWISSPQR